MSEKEIPSAPIVERPLHEIQKEQRVDEIRECLALCEPIKLIRTHIMSKWGVSRSTCNSDIRRAWADYQTMSLARRKQLYHRSLLRRERMLQMAIRECKPKVKEKFVELPDVGPDGKRKRRVEVTRVNVVSVGHLNAAMRAGRELDKLTGVEQPAVASGPVGIDVRFGVGRGQPPADPPADAAAPEPDPVPDPEFDAGGA